MRRCVVILEDERVLRVAKDVSNGWKQVGVQNITIFGVINVPIYDNKIANSIEADTSSDHD